jgi:16S rRNA G527 N7-methylase RsmG
MFHVKQLVAKALNSAALRYGCNVDALDIERCAKLSLWLAPSAARLGLTGFASPLEYVENLIAPGFRLIKHINSEEGQMVEVSPGSGGLGLSLAIFIPSWRVTLLDRRRRVCDFLTLAIRRFQIDNCSVYCRDIRNLSDMGIQYDLAMARAVATSDVLLRHMTHLVRYGGQLALFRPQIEVTLPPELRRTVHEDAGLPGLWLDIFDKMEVE